MHSYQNCRSPADLLPLNLLSINQIGILPPQNFSMDSKSKVLSFIIQDEKFLQILTSDKQMHIKYSWKVLQRGNLSQDI